MGICVLKFCHLHTGEFQLNVQRCAHAQDWVYIKGGRGLKIRPITFNFVLLKLRIVPFTAYTDNYCKLFICILMEFFLGRW